MVHDITDTEQDRLRTYLDATLIRTEGALCLPRVRTVRWAVLWWDKEDACESC